MLVKLTDLYNNPVHVSASHVITIQADATGTGTQITLAVANAEGAAKQYVVEDLATVVSRVQIALQAASR